MIGSVVVAAVGSLALANVNTMAWFGLDEGADAAPPATTVLDAEGETLAEQVVVQLVRESDPSGWKAGKVNATVNDPFSLTCLGERVAWASARTRTLSSDGGQGAVTALAYPAGAGATAHAQIVAAATVCGEGHEENGLGVEGVGYRRGAAAVQVFRRGDVVVVVSASPAERMPDEEWLTDLDDRTAALLADRCLDLTSSPQDIGRNPWVDPESFTGRLTPVDVAVPDVEVTTAEEVTTDPVVPLDVIAPALPEVPARPEPLVPEATDLPPLPLEVERPTAPVPPAEPDLNGRAQLAIPDPEGPGCGWEFTGEAVPEFDAKEAETRHERAVTKEQQRLVDERVEFERGKVAFYRAWAEHERAATAYQSYVDEMTLVVAQWQVVIDARAEYVAEFEKYRRSRDAYDAFVAEQQEARETYDAQVEDCLELGGAFDGEVDTSCPPQIPAILSQTPPQLLPKPVPSALAQLPTGWEPPAPVVEPPVESQDTAGDEGRDQGRNAGGDDREDDREDRGGDGPRGERAPGEGGPGGRQDR